MMYSAGITVLDAIRSCEKSSQPALEADCTGAVQQILEGKNLTRRSRISACSRRSDPDAAHRRDTGALDTALLNVSIL